LPTPAASLPTDPRTGLTLPLRTSLGSQDLARHRALVAVELEVMATKLDRFGWERSRGTAVHDRLLTDWMDALQDFPLPEVQAACRAAILANPNRVPNEGHIVAQIMAARRDHVARLPRPSEPERDAPRISAADAARIVAAAGFAPRRMPAGDA